MKKFLAAITLVLSISPSRGDNPVFDGWYADPEGVVFGDTYWIYPTWSDLYENQVFIDCFSSKDLVNWERHHAVIDTSAVKWAQKCMWAPAVVENGGRYYLFFAANDVHEGEIGGIGVAVSEHPEGPFQDLLGKPLINEIVNGAQPIDQFVFRDDDSNWYMYYGGWGHCNVVRLNESFTSLIPWEDGSVYREITPENYVEGPFMMKKDGKYYFMWSEGGWGGPDYSVAYAMADSPFGPFERKGKILSQDERIATGAGHHSVIRVPETDDYYIVYHRRPLGDTGRDHRHTCIDRLTFAPDGTINTVRMTKYGISPRPVSEPVQLADPTIVIRDGKYRMYGTNKQDGIMTLESDDLITWSVPDRFSSDSLALKKGESYGTKGFWAPQVLEIGSSDRMLYTADENIALATDESGEGRFIQSVQGCIQAPTRQIDPYLFVDDDGKEYLYHVKLHEGNTIWVSGFDSVSGRMIPDTSVQCITATEPWEWTDNYPCDVQILEGPTVLKEDGKYYLFYSANHYMSQDYAVGYAVSTLPFGPWIKKGMLLSRDNTGIPGTGHGDVFRDREGNLKYVFHSHASDSKVHPRRTLIVGLHYDGDGFTIDPDSMIFPIMK